MGDENAKIIVLVKGNGGEHVMEGPSLSRSQAEEDFAKIRNSQGSPDQVDVPWLVVRGTRVIAATLTDDR